MKLRLKRLGTCSKPTDYLHPIHEFELQVISQKLVNGEIEESILGTIDNVLMAAVDRDKIITFTMRDIDVRA